MDGTETVKKEEIKLDGNVVSQEQLNEAQKNQAVRIVETEPGNFKTLQRLRD